MPAAGERERTRGAPAARREVTEGDGGGGGRLGTVVTDSASPAGFEASGAITSSYAVLCKDRLVVRVSRSCGQPGTQQQSRKQSKLCAAQQRSYLVQLSCEHAELTVHEWAGATQLLHKNSKT